MSRSPMRSQALRNGNATKRNMMMGQWMDKSTAIPRGLPRSTPEEDDSSGYDCSKKDVMQVLVDELHSFNESQIYNVNKQVEDFKRDRQDFYRKAMTKLSKSIRQMSIREFNETYDCSLTEILTGNSSNYEGDAIMTSVAPKIQVLKKRDHLSVMQTTPALTHKVGRYTAPGTITRTVRRGEVAYSENGSPVGIMDENTSLVATVCKKHKGNSRLPHAMIQLSVEDEDGETIQIDADDVEGMTTPMKEKAAAQLQLLQDQLSEVMGKLK